MAASVISPIVSSIKSALKAEVRYPKKAALVAFAFLLVCWTPALLAGFPGYFSYDSGLVYLGQWGQYSSGELNAHHPVLHTLFVGALISVGQMFAGSFNMGVFFAVAVQAVVVSLILTFALFQLLALGMRRMGFLVCVAYLGLNPIIQLFAFCTTKDVLFSAFVVLYAVLVFRVARGGKFLDLCAYGRATFSCLLVSFQRCCCVLDSLALSVSAAQEMQEGFRDISGVRTDRVRVVVGPHLGVC